MDNRVKSSQDKMLKKKLPLELGIPGMLLLCMSLFLLSSFSTKAADIPEKPEIEQIDFLGTMITPHIGSYLVRRDVNVRGAPKTSAKKVGKLKRGERIEVVGIAKGPWVAIQREGSQFGFTHGKFVLPLIDGTLKGSLVGLLTTETNWACDFRISFVGKTLIVDDKFSISDYEVQWFCLRDGQKISFLTPMFMTEVPYTLSFAPVYQITIDVLGFEDTVDGIFSTTVFFERDKDRVGFDSVTDDTYGRKPEIAEYSAPSIEAALIDAAKISFQSWTEKFWKEIQKLPSQEE